ncbi:MAG TPA: SdpI family protein [Polyangiaceae bacterium]|nr:SdpI family protein [Polyangiaceae bacterium]
MPPFAIFGPVGLLLVALGLPLYRGKVKQNAWYGVRLPLTLDNERAWFELNRRGGMGLVVLGAVVLAVALVLLVLDLPREVSVAAHVGVLLFGTTIVGMDILRAASRWPEN